VGPGADDQCTALAGSEVVRPFSRGPEPIPGRQLAPVGEDRPADDQLHIGEVLALVEMRSDFGAGSDVGQPGPEASGFRAGLGLCVEQARCEWEGLV